jgi:hypothetical protein
MREIGIPIAIHAAPLVTAIPNKSLLDRLICSLSILDAQRHFILTIDPNLYDLHVHLLRD